MDGPDPFPDMDLRAEELIRLANHYRGAANDLRRLSEEKGPSRVAPCRLCAVQAIELYLAAFLLQRGHPPECLRAAEHDLAQRAALASAGGLALRRRTAIHLATMTARREHLVLRYDPRMRELAPLNRLWATLDEIARKATLAVADQRAPA